MRSTSKEQVAAARGRGHAALLAAVGFDSVPNTDRTLAGLGVRLELIGAAESRLASLKLGYVAALEEEYSAAVPPAAGPDSGPGSGPDSTLREWGDKQWWKEDVATALGISCWQAKTLERTARVLRTLAPVTAAALAEGLITLPHAIAIADNLHALTPEQAGALDEQLIHATLTQSLTAYKLRGQAERARATVNPADQKEQEETTAARRSLELWRRKADGMGFVSGWLTPEAAAAVDAALGPLAEPLASGDDRTKSQRWHDALQEICSHALSDGMVPADRDGTPAGIQLLVPFSTLFGLNGPGEIPRHGLLSPQAVRRLGCNAWWAPVITSPDGHHALYLGRTQRLPNRALRRYLRVRDGGCRFPGCTIDAARCEPHHLETWGSGGRTDPDNCVSLCCRHHHAAHEGGWKVVRTPEGATRWTSPSGQISTVAPPTLQADDRHLRKTAKAALMRLLNHAAYEGLSGGPDSWPVEPTPIPVPALRDLNLPGQSDPADPAEPLTELTLEQLERLADRHDPPPPQPKKQRPSRRRRASRSSRERDYPDRDSAADGSRIRSKPLPANPFDDEEPPF